MSVRRAGSVAIGNFDGVHLGHRAVLRRAQDLARTAGGRTAALTFDPHPSGVLRPGHAVELLTTASERTERLHEAGVDDVVTLGFDRALSRLEPEAFVTAIVWERLRPSYVVVGTDFAFGRGARGRPADLARLGERLGFGVEVVEPVNLDGLVVSSSRIRDRVRDADMTAARRLLGAPYGMEGIVVRGAGRGRTLGIPTANIVPPEHKLLPPEGVYAVWARLTTGERLPAAADLGKRPTFERQGDLRLEVYLLDGGRDLYGEKVAVDFVRYIRPDRAFDSGAALEEAVREDVRAVQLALGDDGADARPL